VRSVARLQAFDHIIALDQSGTIIEQGPIKSLESHQDYISSLSKSPATTEEKEDVQKAMIPKTKMPVASAIATTDKSRQAGDWTIYAYFFKATGWFHAIFTFCIATINSFCVVFSSKQRTD
jgi:hypothetical protein